jgi:hypothetical protein
VCHIKVFGALLAFDGVLLVVDDAVVDVRSRPAKLFWQSEWAKLNAFRVSPQRGLINWS